MTYFAAPGLKNSIFYNINAQNQKELKKIIIEIVCKYFSLTFDDVTSSSRKHNTLIARYIIMYFMYNKLQFTKSQIGRIFNRDHTTVINALKQMEIIMNPKYDYNERLIVQEISVLI